MNRQLLALSALCFSFGCPPERNPTKEPVRLPRLASGLYEVSVTHVVAADCDGMSARDLVGQTLEMNLALHGMEAEANLEGVAMEGIVEPGRILLDGEVVSVSQDYDDDCAEAPPEPCEDEVAEGGESGESAEGEDAEGEAARTECEESRPEEPRDDCEPRDPREPEVRALVELVLDVDSRSTAHGLLSVDYGMCRLAAKVNVAPLARTQAEEPVECNDKESDCG